MATHNNKYNYHLIFFYIHHPYNTVHLLKTPLSYKKTKQNPDNNFLLTLAITQIPFNKKKNKKKNHQKHNSEGERYFQEVLKIQNNL